LLLFTTAWLYIDRLMHEIIGKQGHRDDHLVPIQASSDTNIHTCTEFSKSSIEESISAHLSLISTRQKRFNKQK
jgi:hypothetical protein